MFTRYRMIRSNLVTKELGQACYPPGQVIYKNEKLCQQAKCTPIFDVYPIKNPLGSLAGFYTDSQGSPTFWNSTWGPRNLVIGNIPRYQQWWGEIVMNLLTRSSGTRLGWIYMGNQTTPPCSPGCEKFRGENQDMASYFKTYVDESRLKEGTP